MQKPLFRVIALNPHAFSKHIGTTFFNVPGGGLEPPTSRL